MRVELDFHPVTEKPTEEGDYLIYNQCDGFHVVEFWDGWGGFKFFACQEVIDESFYVAWARLEDKELFKQFARKRPEMIGEWAPENAATQRESEQTK